MTPPSDPTVLFAELLVALEQRLDWDLLASVYCSDDGQGFFGREQLDAIRETGLLIAGELAGELGALPRSLGRGLYVGPGVAELGPMLCERIVLGRAVRAVTLPGAEPDELNRVLDEIGRERGLHLFTLATDGWQSLVDTRADHGWLVSVLTDPEAFPALHDQLYRRSGEQATGAGDLAQDRRRARKLVERLLDQLEPPALLSTTDEELPLVEAACRARDWTLEVPERARLSAVVGDAVRHCQLRARRER